MHVVCVVWHTALEKQRTTASQTLLYVPYVQVLRVGTCCGMGGNGIWDDVQHPLCAVLMLWCSSGIDTFIHMYVRTYVCIYVHTSMYSPSVCFYAHSTLPINGVWPERHLSNTYVMPQHYVVVRLPCDNELVQIRRYAL